MNSFTLTAVGNLARDPEWVVKNGTRYANICLMGNDYAGEDSQGKAREETTSVWFVAFGSLGAALAENARKGDQLIVQAQMRADNWADKAGEQHYDYSYVVQGFVFGAPGKVKREQFAARHDAREPGALQSAG